MPRLLRPVPWTCWLVTLATAMTACGDSPTAPAGVQTRATSAFNVSVRYVGSPTSAERSAVDAAVATWRSAIVGDLSDVRVTAAANDCFTGQPALDEMVDDLVLFVRISSIDGTGKTLAQSGPCYTRNRSSLPAVGVLMLDADDVRTVEAQGLMHDLVSHEIGHVLGFGTLWPDLQLLTGAGGTDPRFLGASAGSAYQALGGGSSGVPVENAGEDGTRDSHWRESVFGNELMTGYINLGSNPLSAVTIASLHDLGYVTDPTAADPYSLPRAGLRSGAAAEVAGTLHVEGHEVLIKPRRRVGDN